MPTRVIREGMLTSDRVDSLSELAELFYRRLQQVVDDHGRYFAHPTHLRTNCYPARMDRYTDGQVLDWRRECEAAGLVTVYRVGRIEYLELKDFRQQIKSRSKFPSPSDGQSPSGGQSPTPRPPAEPAEMDPCTPSDAAEPDPCTAGDGADGDPCTTRARPVHDPCTLVVGVVEGGGGGGTARAGATGPPLPPLPDPGDVEPLDPDRIVPLRAAGRFDPGDPGRPGVIAAWLIDREREAGRQVRGISSLDPKLRAWVEAGVTDAEIAEAYRLAAAARAERRDPTPLNVGFVDTMLRDVRSKAERGATPLPAASGRVRAPWERDTAAMLAEARRIGLEVDGSWTADDLAYRIRQRHRSQGAAA